MGGHDVILRIAAHEEFGVVVEIAGREDTEEHPSFHALLLIDELVAICDQVEGPVIPHLSFIIL